MSFYSMELGEFLLYGFRDFQSKSLEENNVLGFN